MVIWTHRARADLKAIHDYIAKDSRQNAKRVAHEIRRKADALAEPPHIGRKVPELNDPQLREISAYSWRIIYHLREEQRLHRHPHPQASAAWRCRPRAGLRSAERLDVFTGFMSVEGESASRAVWRAVAILSGAPDLSPRLGLRVAHLL
jgi:plasmid stabilization system protein ParE